VVAPVNGCSGRPSNLRWGLCKECGAPTAFRCDRCAHWRCFGNWVFARQMAALREGKPDGRVEHGKLVRLPGGGKPMAQAVQDECS
jgi:hypothetical protein